MELTDKAKRTLQVREFHEFAIEWQRVTGRLLMVNKRTREIGEEKIRDAEIRQEILDTLVNEGML